MSKIVCTKMIGGPIFFSHYKPVLNYLVDFTLNISCISIEPALVRYRWRLLGDGIVEGRSTEIEHSLRRPVTLHQAKDDIPWVCHGSLPKLNGLSLSKRQGIRRNSQDVALGQSALTS